MEFRRKMCELFDGFVSDDRCFAYFLFRRILCMSEQVTDGIAWFLLLADFWQVYWVLCLLGLFHWPHAPLLGRGQWALARCLRGCYSCLFATLQLTAARTITRPRQLRLLHLQ